MGYQNGKLIFPENLLSVIQEYIDGEYVYIPRKPCNRKAWGVTTKNKQYTFERNIEIFNKYSSGISIRQLAEEYFLSVKTIYKIVAKMKD
ncbi:Mor family transcriptional regulator [Clostridium tetanomorphum]|uniref:CD3324 family protein n=1 Tax=Clostridium tetanomorphum TaxID=1553 RepID=UPI0004456F9E|nr:CD3324 family protein [Clostridium tetanomorphum]KAJ52666.1 hypothetical protein CTM_06761 [Clostridium tetanomorphum DSM 665]MBP1863259.1 Mor family transcriptional regulator [Clostridium tetanomorphum]NRS84367.1 Mor family transcriptional regulator [Clostridium tetanomorphum]SQB92187.1 Mor transcription activator family [Clostridium tetanomorphum]